MCIKRRKVRAGIIKGRKIFHVKFISKSYRIRGRVARTQRKENAMKDAESQNNSESAIEDFGPIIKNRAVRNLISKILMYSAIKIKAKVVPLYSTLNPETSSDSPSAKSNGARLVSARVVINHRTNNGAIKAKNGIGTWGSLNFCRFKVVARITGQRTIKAMDTS